MPHKFVILLHSQNGPLSTESRDVYVDCMEISSWEEAPRGKYIPRIQAVIHMKNGIEHEVIETAAYIQKMMEEFNHQVLTKMEKPA